MNKAKKIIDLIEGKKIEEANPKKIAQGFEDLASKMGDRGLKGEFREYVMGLSVPDQKEIGQGIDIVNHHVDQIAFLNSENKK